MQWIKRFIYVIIFCAVIGISISAYVYIVGSRSIVALDDAQAPIAIVLGAGLRSNGTPSDALTDRLTVAQSLYEQGQVEKILCSGDNGQVQYDEVNAMRVWLLAHSVAAEDIFLDHAGFDTYDSMVRARKVFGITHAVVVTQDFHLPRALYIAHTQGINAIGVSASLQTYRKGLSFTLREYAARIKSFFDVVFHADPMYLGEPVDSTGDGQQTWDEGL